MTESEEEITHTEDEEDLYDLERPSIIHLDYRYKYRIFPQRIDKSIN